jgi:hypothetical protein
MNGQASADLGASSKQSDNATKVQNEEDEDLDDLDGA